MGTRAGKAKGRRKGQEFEDAELFDDGLVTVTRTRAILDGTTYAMANITSVTMLVQPRWTALLVVGLAFAAAGAIVLAKVAEGGSAGAFLLGLGALLALVYWLRKPKYWVRIGTAGAEVDAVYSHDPEWTTRVVEAINEAIISRG